MIAQKNFCSGSLLDVNDDRIQDPSKRGPVVPADEDLWRRIFPDWWKDNRLSSAAFKWPRFSVDRKCLTDETRTLSKQHRDEGRGLAEFNCNESRLLGFDPRIELDDPGNPAHANVYCDLSGNKRKTAARQLAGACKILVVPLLS
jgi:hypothetical protein